ncbi:MAG TPA: BadF/BadG/BcrA/BcrD ATPase family protein, partial [Opitutaceae bacterium]|nr:BadF/BadG/BcrA/BcrD ATPase family protein [Opitutaceae bacterium]
AVNTSTLKIGVDGGGSKTELILVDEVARIVNRYSAPGCNPSIVGPDGARQILIDALRALTASLDLRSGNILFSDTLLCMSGNPNFWQETASALKGFGHVHARPDSLPVLELATEGKAGMVLHAGTGSFVAARTSDGLVHYAGGLGWRFGDPGSGYDLGRRGIAQALLELQGWRPQSTLAAELCAHTGLSDATSITRFFYHDAGPNAKIAAFAPVVLRLAAEGDGTAHHLIADSVSELLNLAHDLAAKLFPVTPRGDLRVGLSGPILTQSTVVKLLRSRTTLPLATITAPPIEGVRKLLARNFS